MNEAYGLFGCGTDQLYTIAVSGYGNDNNATLSAYWENKELIFRGISAEEGSHDIADTYGIGAYPTYILIAPNHDIVEQDMWPISNTQTFVNYFESNGLVQSTCEPLDAIFEADVTEICVDDLVIFSDFSTGVPITWEWTFEGGIPSSSTQKNPGYITYETAGEFDVTLTIHDGVFTTTTVMEDYIIVDECIGIDEISENDIMLYPVPAKDQLNITSGTLIAKVQVYNNLGQLLIETNVNDKSFQVNISDLTAGLYIIKLETENNSILKQLVIE